MAKNNKPESSSEEDEEIYEVETLLKHRRSKNKDGKIEYLVKWFGYSKEYDTWESEKNILSDELIKEYWNKQSISREDFLKGRKEKRKANHTETKGESKPESTKKSKLEKSQKPEQPEQPEQTEQTEQTEKTEQPEQTEKTVLISNPPSGLKWEDLVEVINLFYTKEKKLFGEVRWKNEEKSYMLSSIIRAHNPIPLLKYYENLISFK